MSNSKKVFMQNAPSFVLTVGIGTLAIFLLASIAIMFTDDWGFGIYLFLLSGTALTFLYWYFRRMEKSTGKSLREMIEINRKNWT